VLFDNASGEGGVQRVGVSAAGSDLDTITTCVGEADEGDEGDAAAGGVLGEGGVALLPPQPWCVGETFSALYL